MLDHVCVCCMECECVDIKLFGSLLYYSGYSWLLVFAYIGHPSMGGVNESSLGMFLITQHTLNILTSFGLSLKVLVLSPRTYHHH